MNYFETFDLFLATVLQTAGEKLVLLDRGNPQKVKFVFEREEDLDQIVQNYWNKSLNFEPQALFTNLKILKNRIHSS